MKKPSMERARRTADRGLKEIRDILDARLGATVAFYAKRNPTKEVIACSAMGTWTLEVGDETESREPTVFRMFEKMLKAYGWNAIPAPVMWTYKPGEGVVRKTDW